MSSYFPQVGDFVMIRPWDDMVKEFGTDSYGDIPTLPITPMQLPISVPPFLLIPVFMLLLTTKKQTKVLSLLPPTSSFIPVKSFLPGCSSFCPIKKIKTRVAKPWRTSSHSKERCL